MAKWITQPHREEWIEYTLFFANPEHRGSGYSFDAQPDGTVDLSKLTELQRTSWDDCQGWESRFWSTPRHHYHAGSVRCPCSRVHHLNRSDSQCECGQLFNAVGQALLPREMWEES